MPTTGTKRTVGRIGLMNAPAPSETEIAHSTTFNPR